MIDSVLDRNLNDLKKSVFIELEDRINSYIELDESLGSRKKRNDKNDYKIYHSSYTGAVSEVVAHAKRNGYHHDEDEMFDKVGSGPRKPSEGKTNRFSVTLYKNGKKQKKGHHFQVYGMGNGKYELNQYFS